MVQINLLPDVKLEYVKARRLKRTVLVLCFLISGVSLAIFALFFVSVVFVQGTHLSNLEEDIKTETAELEGMQDIARILTVQNQLNSLPALHKDKPVTSRVFTYVKQLAPSEASISSLTVNFDEQSMEITGNAVNLAGVNKFADILKFTSYTIDGEETADAKQLAFSEVTLTQFGVSASGVKNGKPASYTIKLKYEPGIFSSEKAVKLVVPNQVTTRSEVEKPQNVFEAPTTTGQEGN